MNKHATLIFNLGVVLCVLVGIGSLVNALPQGLRTLGSIMGLLMVGLGYAMKRNASKNFKG